MRLVFIGTASLVVILAGCSAQQGAAPAAVAAVNIPPASEGLKSYIGKTCKALVSTYYGAYPQIDTYVLKGGKVYVEHLHGRYDHTGMDGGDRLREVVVTGDSDWPYKFVSDSLAPEYPKPTTEGMDVKIAVRR